MDEAVNLADLKLAENLRAATGDTLMQYMQPVLDAGVPVKVCLPCAKARSITDLPPKWVLDKGVEAIRASEQGFTTWTF